MVDTMTGIARAKAARAAGAKVRRFDWERAADIIIERRAMDAGAGLLEDMDYTAGTILAGGNPLSTDESYRFVSSLWATPVLVIDSEEIDCWCEADADDADEWPPEVAERVRAALAAER